MHQQWRTQDFISEGVKITQKKFQALPEVFFVGGSGVLEKYLVHKNEMEGEGVE